MEANKVGRIKVRKVLLVVCGIALVGSLIWVGFTPRDITSCNAPEGYTYVTNVMARDLGKNPVYVARAIIATGEGTPGGKRIVIPACGSSDPSLMNVSNIFIVIDGRLAFVANGAIGSGAPLAQATQP